MSQGELSNAPSSYHSPWTVRTFVDSYNAEAALCADRPVFVSRRHIMELIPEKIMKYIDHSDVNAHITGFQELFLYLNTRRPRPLRRLIEAYFRDTPYLRGHLSQPSTLLVRFLRP